MSNVSFISGSSIAERLCAPTTLVDATTITTAGTYCIGAEIDAVTPITIAVSDVTLNLNGYSLLGTNGIVINDNLSRITIYNGGIVTTTVGIDLGTNCSEILIKNLRILNPTTGISATGTASSIIDTVTIVQADDGILADSCEHLFIYNCTVVNAVQQAIVLTECSACQVQDCTVSGTGTANLDTSDSVVRGIVCREGTGNSITTSRTVATVSPGLDNLSFAHGIGLEGSATNSRIIDCTVTETSMAPTSVGIPYGIGGLMTFDGFTEITKINPDEGSTTETVHAVSWSPDGQYLALAGAVSGTTNSDLFLYRFDRATGTATQVDAINPDGGSISDIVFSAVWSPDGNYLAVGGNITGNTNRDLFVYRFDSATEKLIEVASINPDGGSVADQVFTLDWSPDGTYIAAGGLISGATNFDLFIVKFDVATETLTVVYRTNPDGGATNEQIFTVDWSYDGLYLAIGGIILGNTGYDLFIYRFNSDTETLTEVISAAVDGNINQTVRSVSWSPDGEFLAVGGTFGGFTSFDLFIYQFNRDPISLTKVAAINPGGGDTSDGIRSVDWSPDGKYLAIGGILSGTPADDVIIYTFNTVSFALTQIASVNPDAGSSNEEVRSVDWSYDGFYLAIGGVFQGTTNFDAIIYQLQNIPQNNIIRSCTTYANPSPTAEYGIGMSADSSTNIVIGNLSYNNPDNYQGVTNIFDPDTQDAPSILQNVSLYNGDL